MSTKLSLQIDTISNLTTVSRRTIERVLSRHRQTGLVTRQDLTDSRGRKRALDYNDLAVNHSRLRFVFFNKPMYLVSVWDSST
jgi:transposase